MKMLNAVALVLSCAGVVCGQTPQAPAPPQDFLANKVANLEQRVTALEQKAGIHVDPAAKRTYGEAYTLALETGKPLVVWNGDAICASCIHDTADEFVSYVGTVEGCPQNAITVAVPENGQLWGVGAITSWKTGDATFGHVPSVRRALLGWKERRARVSHPSQVTQVTTATTATYAAPMMVQAPMMSGMIMSSGACASCGSAGAFGRRR